MNKEFLHMQKLAGLITESEYKQKAQLFENEENISPEQAVSQVSKIVNKAENDPSIDKLAKDIASNSKEAQELIDTLKKLGVNPASLNENTEDTAKKLALMFAKTAKEKVENQVSESNEDITGRVMTGLASAFGGAVAAPWLAEKLGMFVTKYTDAFLTVHTNPEWWVPVAGAAAGILLTVIGAKVYDLMSGE